MLTAWAEFRVRLSRPPSISTLTTFCLFDYYVDAGARGVPLPAPLPIKVVEEGGERLLKKIANIGDFLRIVLDLAKSCEKVIQSTTDLTHHRSPQYDKRVILFKILDRLHNGIDF